MGAYNVGASLVDAQMGATKEGGHEGRPDSRPK